MWIKYNKDFFQPLSGGRGKDDTGAPGEIMTLDGEKIQSGTVLGIHIIQSGSLVLTDIQGDPLFSYTLELFKFLL